MELASFFLFPADYVEDKMTRQYPLYFHHGILHCIKKRQKYIFTRNINHINTPYLPFFHLLANCLVVGWRLIVYFECKECGVWCIPHTQLHIFKLPEIHGHDKELYLRKVYVLMLKVPQTLKRYLVLPFVVRVLFIIYWLRGRGKGGRWSARISVS